MIKRVKGGTILNMKIWKIWLFSSVCFLLAGIINFVEKKYLLGVCFVSLGLTYIGLSITHYKKYNRPSIIEVSDLVLEKMNTELRTLITKGEKNKAIQRYRIITGSDLKQANDYINLLLEENINANQ